MRLKNVNIVNKLQLLYWKIFVDKITNILNMGKTGMIV